ncbi:MAG: hypothetical protein P1U44_06875 [Vicingaceae bacterium]|jgi:hypothetical protein|nr:hypothetical protein [Flavobacteriales bacterium]MDF1675426.1 hypothetical protein [Vicingaceae bacterium]|tara:strand:+ start:11827 stop:11967 length:141 start_codon:yes stop_codon:yes gene_type:complete
MGYSFIINNVKIGGNYSELNGINAENELGINRSDGELKTLNIVLID